MTENAKIPPNYQAVMPYLILKNACGFIDFAVEVFNAKPGYVAKSDQQTIVHAEIMIGVSTIMIAESSEIFGEKPAGLFVYVDLADVAYGKALKAGATVLTPNAPIE